ncbi:MAG: hypothetical protein DYG89_25370 [Caldilinea sp. CFX5]|nr:hypothetical protein [Caldilinea sp. CFX5]
MQVLVIIKKDLRLLLRNRGAAIPLFLMPLAFIIPICLAFGADGYNRDADFKRPLPVANYDLADGQPFTRTQGLLDALADSFAIETLYTPERVAGLGLTDDPICAQPTPACEETLARLMIERRYRTAALIIPNGLAAAIAAGAPTTVTLLYNPAGDAAERQIYEAVVQGATSKLSIENQVLQGFRQFQDLLALAPSAVKADIEGQAADKAATPQPALTVASQQPSAFTLRATPNTLQQTIPGYTVMFVFFLVGYVAGALREEKNSGTFRRLLYFPAARFTLLAGKLGAAIIIGLLQIAVMFGVGHWGFGLQMGRDPLALLLLTLAVVTTAVCLGLAALTFHLDRMINLPLIVAALLAGCAFPVDWLPPLIRTINVVAPQTWAMRGYQDLLTRGQGLTAVLPSIGVLLLFAAISFVAAIRRFDFETER